MQILEPYNNPFLEKSKCRRKRKKEREKTPLIVHTYFRDIARKPLGPIPRQRGQREEWTIVLAKPDSVVYSVL